jgi:hypothetical protein
MAVEMNKISTCGRNYSGSYGGTGESAKKTLIKGNGMYTFVYGKGSSKVSETRHCSEAQAKSYKEQLEKAGH